MGTQWQVIMFQLLFNLELGTFMSSNLKNDVWQFIEKAVTVITIQNIVKHSNGPQSSRHSFSADVNPSGVWSSAVESAVLVTFRLYHLSPW